MAVDYRSACSRVFWLLQNREPAAPPSTIKIEGVKTQNLLPSPTLPINREGAGSANNHDFVKFSNLLRSILPLFIGGDRGGKKQCSFTHPNLQW
jgi:hypothetical protein